MVWRLVESIPSIFERNKHATRLLLSVAEDGPPSEHPTGVNHYTSAQVAVALNWRLFISSFHLGAFFFPPIVFETSIGGSTRGKTVRSNLHSPQTNKINHTTTTTTITTTAAAAAIEAAAGVIVAITINWIKLNFSARSESIVFVCVCVCVCVRVSRGKRRGLFSQLDS